MARASELRLQADLRVGNGQLKRLTGVVESRWYCLESLRRFRMSFMASNTWSLVPSSSTTLSLTPGS